MDAVEIFNIIHDLVENGEIEKAIEKCINSREKFYLINKYIKEFSGRYQKF